MRPVGAGDAHRHLADLDGVGEAGAQVVVVGGDEDLALARQATERPAVLDAVEVALEAGAEGVRRLGRAPDCHHPWPGRARRQEGLLGVLAVPRGPMGGGRASDVEGRMGDRGLAHRRVGPASV